MTKRRLLIRRLASVVVLTAVVTGLASLGLAGEVFAGFQRRATDSLLPAAPSSPKVVVVGIDRKSLSETGVAWPWPRAMIAQLTDRLATAGAAVIAYDVVFATAKEGDDAFAASIAGAGNVVLGEELSTKPGRDGGPVRAVSGSGIAPDLTGSDYTIGHVQVNADPGDAINRSIPMVAELPDGTFLPALSLASVMRYRGIEGPVTIRPNGVQIGNRLVPTGAAQSMLLNFSSRLSDPGKVVSAVDVLDGSVGASKLGGRIAIVGAVDPALGDQRLAPINKAQGVPGVLLHANAVNTMLTASYIEPTSDGRTLLWVALLTLLVGLVVLMLPLWLSPLIAVALGAGYFVLSVLRFGQGEALNFVYPLLAVALAFVGALALRYFGETRQRRRVTALFSQYVPEAVAKRLVDEDRASSAAEGERLDMTVLFCDLRGFTALSEQLSPTIVRVMLNHYYDRVTELVLGMRGTLMKYVGDEVFAVWGAPLPSDDHPARALECAIAIQELTPELNRELVEQGAPEISFGIGLNTGEAVAAHFGGGRRRQYDVVGDTVNVGARLCSIAARGQIILSDEVLTRVPSPPAVEPLGRVELKGVSRELRLWAVVPGSVNVPGAGERSGDQGASSEVADVGR